MYIKQTEAAKIAGVTRQTINGMRKRGATFFTDDGQIDIENEEWQEYIRGKDDPERKLKILEAKITQPPRTPKKKKDPPKVKKHFRQPNGQEEKRQREIEKKTKEVLGESTYYDRKLSRQREKETKDQVLTMQKVKMEKAIEETKKAVLIRRRLEGELVETKMVSSLVYDYLNALNGKLLNMGDSLIDRLIQLVESKSDNSRQEGIDLIHSEISKEIKSTKKEMVRNLEILKEGE